MALWIVVLLTFLTHMGFAGSRVVVALFALDQGATPVVVGTVVSLYALIPIVLALPAGRMTDRLGFKIPIVFGTSGVCVALLLPAIWPSLTVLYFTASLLGVSFMVFQIATHEEVIPIEELYRLFPPYVVPVARLAPSSPEVAALPPRERYLLSRVDGKRDVGALTVMTPVGELETLRALRKFQRLGLVAFRAG